VLNFIVSAAVENRSSAFEHSVEKMLAVPNRPQKLNGWSGSSQLWHPPRLGCDCLSQQCPTQMDYWAKKYVTTLTRAAHWMTYYWGPHMEWFTLTITKKNVA